MGYSISSALEALPYIFIGIIAIAFIALEVSSFRERLTCGPSSEPGRGGFIPPGDGYEYYVGSGTIVYILKKGSQSFRVYQINGQPPANAKMRKDRVGTYFVVRARTAAEAEAVVDRAYRG